MATAKPLANIGDGVIDNIIIDTSAHLVTGVIVLITMTAAVVTVVRHALRGEPVTMSTRVVLAGAQLALAAQMLLGIKLLDQGQGIVQLYIHYVGGLIPLGAFLIGGWWARGDTARSSRILAVLLAVGYLSAIMAFFIGRSYANSVL